MQGVAFVSDPLTSGFETGTIDLPTVAVAAAFAGSVFFVTTAILADAGLLIVAGFVGVVLAALVVFVVVTSTLGVDAADLVDGNNGFGAAMEAD